MNIELLLPLIAVLWVTGQQLTYFTYICCRFPSDQWYARYSDSANYPEEPLLIATYKAIIGQRKDRRLVTESRQLRSLSRRYCVTQQIGAGDLSDVYLAKTGAKLVALKVPRSNQGDQLLSNEVEWLRRLQQAALNQSYGAYLPKVVERFRSQDRYVSVFEYAPGFVAARDLRIHFPDGLQAEHIAWIFNRTLEVLGFVHSQGIVHGAVLPTHLMLHPDSHSGRLVGWTHAVSIGESIGVASREYLDWYPPESHRKECASPATDIYMAAATMVWLAGGDPLRRTLPDSFPVELHNILLECLRHAPHERPSDAWELHERLADVLRKLYGPPKFHDLWKTTQASSLSVT